MKNKVFISYSHTDEEYMLQLTNHLSAIKREGLIEEWHDRKIIAGQEWDKEISQNLTSSTIIILLISSDFLASDYCTEKEVKIAMEMHENRNAVVVPIIIRSCDWARSPFAKLQALPKNAEPIKKWGDEDDAWLDVCKSLRATIESFSRTHVLVEKHNNLEYFEIDNDFQGWLEDTEILLTHKHVSKVLLGDIFVVPDLKVLIDDDKDMFHIKSFSNVLSKRSKYLIFGDEQQGKTTLLKYGFKQLYKNGLVPIYIEGEKINTSDYTKVIKKAVKKQYVDNLDYKDKRIVLLIDDFSNIKLNDKARATFLSKIEKEFSHIIITGSKTFSYIVPEIQEFDDYSCLELLKFGHEKRSEITEKWVSLGIEEQISDEELYQKSDELKLKLDSIIRGNIVPPKPIYVLMLLQMFEAYSQQNLELTSHGHCYQELIYQSFRQSSVSQENVGSYLNILTELAWSQYKNSVGMLPDELEDFFDVYEIEYLKVDRLKVVDDLKASSILITLENKTKFKYPYLFYFFVAKKIAEGYSKSDEIKNEVEILLRELHREDYANILVFVTHHTKDDWILDEIQITLMELFEEEEKAKLSKGELSFMDDFLAEIPKLVMEKRKISEERKNHNKRLDKIEEEKTEDEAIDSSDLLAKINKVFKGMEIAGQIVRNRHSSLPRDSLYSLVEQGAGTGLRFLNYFINLSDMAKSEVVRSIEEHLYEHPNLTDEQVHKMAETTFLQITYGVINGVIRKIASAIGSKEAQEIYDQLEMQESTPATILLNKAISMHFNKSIDIDEIKKVSKALSKNAVCTRILRELVIQHTYMFPVKYKDKQKLSECLDISLQGQLFLDRQKEAQE